MDEIEQIAEEHWDWLQSLLKLLYITAFIHGAKHQKELATPKDKE